MINWKKLAVALGASAALLCGCTQSNIVSPTNGTVQGDGVPDVEIDKDIPINWLEVREDLRDVYLDPYGDFAAFVLDLDARYNEETGLLTVLIPVTHKTTGADAIPYAQAVLKTIGDSVATQNFYYKSPDQESGQDDTYYGSFFDEHDVCVQVFYYDDEGDESAYLMNDTMKAGEQRALVALVD